MIHYTDYEPIKTPHMNEGDIILVRNFQGQVGINNIYRLENGVFRNIPNPYQGRSGVVEYVKDLDQQSV